MFIPKKTKYKKQQKGRSFKKIKTNKITPINKTGKIILKAISAGRISSKHLIACKQTINKIIKKYGQLNVIAFADTPISKKPLEIRMGKGKGGVDLWVCRAKPGTILFEINITYKLLGIKAMQLIQKKLPIKTKIIL